MSLELICEVEINREGGVNQASRSLRTYEDGIVILKPSQEKDNFPSLFNSAVSRHFHQIYSRSRFNCSLVFW